MADPDLTLLGPDMVPPGHDHLCELCCGVIGPEQALARLATYADGDGVARFWQFWHPEHFRPWVAAQDGPLRAELDALLAGPLAVLP